jgi:lipopolysaccharide export system protein LptA
MQERKKAVAALLLGAALAAFPVWAAEPPKLKLPRSEEAGALPIEITADRLTADNARNSVAFEGGVVAKQGDVTLGSDRLYAEYSRAAGAIEKIVAEGRVRVAQPGRSATGEKAVFYNLEQRIVLSGNAELTQGENTLKGESVTILLRENRSTVSGGEGGGRVKAVIFPKGFADGKEGGGK